MTFFSEPYQVIVGEQALKGVSQPIVVYQVLQESATQSRLDIVAARGLTPLVGRDAEVTLLLERWEQVKEGHGQVVVLSGEAGIGKSRLVEAFKDHVIGEPHTRQECRCSPYHTNSAFFPLIELLQRTLGWQQDDTPEAKLHKLETALAGKHLDVAKAVPLFTTLLSLPLPADRYAPLPLSSQQQRQQTLEALLAIFSELAARHPVLLIVEDLHWIDPSTLELLDLLIEQAPTAAIFILLDCRPTFRPPWASRAHLTSLMLNRLPHDHVEQIIAQLTHGKSLPTEVLHQIVARADGVPLFVEEMTKAMLESGHLQEVEGHYELVGALPAFAIPATLHDSLMARLDRLVTAKGVAQLGATIGRHFSYALLQAIAPLDEPTLQRELHRLVEAELVQQQGLPPQAAYTFRHALIQEAAYQSLLKRTRQQYHQQIAQMLTERFPETAATQPELLAHHYTEAGVSAQAVIHWQRAGERAVERSAYVEALGHFHEGLELLTTLPDTLERTHQELTLHIALGRVLMATKGQGAPEVERAFTRAYELCQGLEATPQLFPVLGGLCGFYAMRAQLPIARELAEQLLTLAQRQQDPTFLLQAHQALGGILYHLGELASARTHLEQAAALYNPQLHRSPDIPEHEIGVVCLFYMAWTQWLLGYPAQALKHNEAALTLAQELLHPFNQAHALMRAVILLHMSRRGGQAVHEQVEAAATLAAEQKSSQMSAVNMLLQGLALATQGHSAAGIPQMCQGLDAWRKVGAELFVPYWLALLAEMCVAAEQIEAGLTMLDEAVALIDKTGDRFWEAELYRLKGELLLHVECGVRKEDMTPEACFQRALDIARQQQAKSLELRAVMSLSRLLQHQGKPGKARQLLGEVYGWFTEGFDTADVQEAKALLEELEGGVD